MKADNIMVVDAYNILRCLNDNQQEVGWFSKLWNTHIPTKNTIFLWLVWRNKNLTWENLQKRNWIGPGYCVLCMKAEEDNGHLFIKCPKVSTFWQYLDATYGLNIPQFICFVDKLFPMSDDGLGKCKLNFCICMYNCCFIGY